MPGSMEWEGRQEGRKPIGGFIKTFASVNEWSLIPPGNSLEFRPFSDWFQLRARKLDTSNSYLHINDWQVLSETLIFRPFCFPCMWSGGFTEPEKSGVTGFAEGAWAEGQRPLRKVRQSKYGTAGWARPDWKPREGVSRRWSMEESSELSENRHLLFNGVPEPLVWVARRCHLPR